MDMKLTEIRNKLFGLSDLKGLIKENTFDEGLGRGGFDWKAFYLDDPNTRLQMSYEDFVNMCNDPNGIKTLEKYRFNGNIPLIKAFTNAQDRNKSLIGDVSGLRDAITFFDTFFNENGEGLTSQALYKYDELKDVIINGQLTPEEQNQYKNNLKNVEMEVKTYFNTISKLAVNAVNAASSNGIEITGIKPSLFQDTIDKDGNVVSFVYNPKSLYFFFVNVCVGSGTGNHIKGFLKNTESYYRNFIKSFYDTVKANTKFLSSSENDSIQTLDTDNNFSQQLQTDTVSDMGYDDIIQYYFLNPIGVEYGTYLSNCSDILYDSYFAGNNINKIVDIINKIKQDKGNAKLSIKNSGGANGKYMQTAGGLMYCSLAFLSSYGLNIKNLIEQVFNYMQDRNLFRFRNSLYRKKYEDITGNIFDDKFLSDISTCFKIPVDYLFDPLIAMKLNEVNSGFISWIKTRSLDELLKAPIYNTFNVSDPKSGFISPIERIFLSAYALKRRLDASYGKYGTGPERNKMTIDILLSEAGDGLRTFKEWNPTKIVPSPQDKLNIMYEDIQKDFKDKEGKMTDTLAFWQLLEIDNQIKDKTQTDIYYFLIDHSGDDVKWTYEYNRNEKIDADLGQKSIDILAEVPGRHFCFEYQGEQHYRLLQVKLEDDKQFPVFLAMKYFILHKCGFLLDKIGKNYYVTGLNPDLWEKNKDRVKSIIIDTYIFFLERITSDKNIFLSNSFNIDAFVRQLYNLERTKTLPYEIDEGLAGHTVNRNFKYFSGQRKAYIDYFNGIITKGADDEETFDEPSLNQQIPYIGSPTRFMDEIETAVNMARDWEKRTVLKNKRDGIWDIVYIVPNKSITADDFKYTQTLAGDGNASAVFRWEGPKRKNTQLVNFMVSNGIGVEKEKMSGAENVGRKTTVSENKRERTLFETVVKEAFDEQSYLSPDKSMIYSFLQKSNDFTQSDIESNYRNVYRPGWHERPFQFWFNPPYSENGISVPVLSGTIVLLDDGKIMVESMRDNLFYDLDNCLGDSIRNFIYSLQNQI